MKYIVLTGILTVTQVGNVIAKTSKGKATSRKVKKNQKTDPKKGLMKKCKRDSQCKTGLRCSNWYKLDRNFCTYGYLSRKENQRCISFHSAECKKSLFCLDSLCKRTKSHLSKKLRCHVLRSLIWRHEGYVRFQMTSSLLAQSFQEKKRSKVRLLYYLKIGKKLLHKWDATCKKISIQVENEWMLLRTLVVNKKYNRPI